MKEENGVKQYEYLIELIYLQSYNATRPHPESTEEEPLPDVQYQDIKVSSQLFSCTGPDKSVVRNDAAKELNKIRREGVKLSGGAIIESWILPSAMLQLGIIDVEKLEQEASAEPVGGAVSSEVPEVAETTTIDLNETS
jgi:phage-related baseplate assembly protein